MTIRISKAHCAILWTFNKGWCWSHFLDAVEETNHQYLQSNRQLPLILNLRYELPDERLAFANLRYAVNRMAQNTIIFVLEGAYLHTRIIINIFKNHIVNYEERVHVVSTLEEARHLIKLHPLHDFPLKMQSFLENF